MRSNPAAVALGAGLLVRRGPPECSVQQALEFFNYGYPVPAGCVDTLQQQATDWCRDYLSVDPVTAYASTVTPDTSYLTVTETSTTVTTTTSETTATTDTTATTSFTSTVEVTVITTSTTGVPAGPSRKRGLEARRPDPTPGCGGPVCINPAVSCIDLTEPNLRRRPAAKMSEACSCLNPAAATVTADVTTAEATTVSTSETLTEINTSTEVSTTVFTETSLTTESTATTTATTTSIVYTKIYQLGDSCDIGAANYDFRAACGGSYVCNIPDNAGEVGSCAVCISNFNFCGQSGPTPNCCTGYCQGGYCRPPP